MLILKGKDGKQAKVYTDNVDDVTVSQIINILNQDFVGPDANIAIMPDTHAGKGCVVGFTARLGDKVVPNLVGVDIGCGVLTVELGKLQDLDFSKIDAVIRENIPSGKNVHDAPYMGDLRIPDLKCYKKLKNKSRIYQSVGTLGGGNHYIEIGKDVDGYIYLMVHSGSRNLGKQVAEIYQEMAVRDCSVDIKAFVEGEKLAGRTDNLQAKIQELKNMVPSVPKDLCYLSKKNREDYLHDMEICQLFAEKNRLVMANAIVKSIITDYKYVPVSYFDTVHNYINFNDGIVRKGAVSAYPGQRLIIPINMRDGALLCYGKGNPDWNFSAPHGAGRIMSRSVAKKSLTMEEYQSEMEGIFTTSVNENTLDESPMAYKPMQEIIDNIQDTVVIEKLITPLYNFKAGE